MKTTITIDATPDELRAFFGWPPVAALHEELIAKLKDNVDKGIDGFDPATLLKPFLPAQFQSMETLQKSFWDAFSTSGKTATKKGTDKA